MTTTACATETATGASATGDDPTTETALKDHAPTDDRAEDPPDAAAPTDPAPADATARDPATTDSPEGAPEGPEGPEPPAAHHTPHVPVVPRDPFPITADGGYAARLAPYGDSGDAWCAERWTLDGPEPYAVPLPVGQPEEYDTGVLPMADGRVLVQRAVEGRQLFSLLYPTGPGTGELPLGAVESTRLRLLPPSPIGSHAYALAVGPRSTALWLVAGGAFGPEHLAELPGRCTGGVWLDRAGRMLAVDQELDGRTKTVAVDLERGGEVSALLQITEESNDRLLLADAASGLILVRSDAAGHDRLGWGVLGSTLPVRFPECLRLADCAVTPFAIQPGQALMPEHCAVALRVDGAAGTWIGLWRPMERRVQHFAAPTGWLAGSGLWTTDGVLQLPYATGLEPCGVAQLPAPPPREPEPTPDPVPEPVAAPRPVPLQQASRTGQLALPRATSRT
ncbi:hypothetical protein [Streptomyces boluensis]|uniref:Uncharacterized protein n=1 Tax=Streptomyces boluensis TaxID=1775135 RepID=A0A964UVF6_9ACTN|nr:hypothetical protein [Streptomyces boluensis]NBE52365.1 hypothetical protein [Streptomyces boluensis]